MNQNAAQGAPKPVDLCVKIDAGSYRTFVVFDLLRHQKRWQRPLVFAAILLGCAGVCLSQVGQKQGAGLLCAVLSLVGLGLPAVYFGQFFRGLSRQCKVLAKAGPTAAYRLRLTDAGLDVWMPGEMDRPQPPQTYPWAQMHRVYRTPEALYLYVQPGKAFLLPAAQLADGGAAAWELAQNCPSRKEIK